MKSEFEAKEEAAQEELQRYTKEFIIVDTQIKGIDECLASKVENAEQFYFLLGQISAMGLEDINETIRIGKYKEMFMTPPPPGIVGVRNPANAWYSLSAQIRAARVTLVSKREVLGKVTLELEEKAHRRKVDRLTLEYGKASVELTTINIAVAVGVPVIIFFVTLLGTIAFEAFKPEILDWIRQAFGLLPLPK